MNTQHEPTEQEMLEEHQAAARVKAEAEEKERQERWQKQQQENTRKRVAREMPIMQAIHDAVERAGKFVPRLDHETARLTVSGIDMMFFLRIEEEMAGGHWSRRRETGKLRVVVGSYGNRKSYPQRKDGGHNYDAIATEIAAYVSATHARERSEKQQASNEGVVKRLVEELYGDKWQYKLSASSMGGRPVRVKITIDDNMTVDEARKLILSLRKVTGKDY